MAVNLYQIVIIVLVLFLHHPCSITTIELEDETLTACATNTTVWTCKELEEYSNNEKVQPSIRCILEEEDAFCTDGVNNGTADFALISANSYYYATRMDTSMVAFVEQPVEEMIYGVLLVNTKIIKTMSDIKDKRGSFSEYGDAAFFGFTNAMRIRGWLDSCPITACISQLLGPSCMPGIEDDVSHEPFPVDLDTDKLCELCQGVLDGIIEFSCHPHDSNACFGTEGALNCAYRRGDFAVVTLRGPVNIGDLIPAAKNKSFKIMCKNGTLAQTDRLDDACFLIKSPATIITSKKDNPKNSQIMNTLQQVERVSAIRLCDGKCEKDMFLTETGSTTKNKDVNEHNNITKIEPYQTPPSSDTLTYVLLCVSFFLFTLVIIIYVYMKLKTTRGVSSANQAAEQPLNGIELGRTNKRNKVSNIVDNL